MTEFVAGAAIVIGAAVLGLAACRAYELGVRDSDVAAIVAQPELPRWRLRHLLRARRRCADGT